MFVVMIIIIGIVLFIRIVFGWSESESRKTWPPIQVQSSASLLKVGSSVKVIHVLICFCHAYPKAVTAVPTCKFITRTSDQQHHHYQHLLDLFVTLPLCATPYWGETYCWWKNSYTTWDVQNHVKNVNIHHIHWCRISINSSKALQSLDLDTSLLLYNASPSCQRIWDPRFLMHSSLDYRCLIRIFIDILWL